MKDMLIKIIKRWIAVMLFISALGGVMLVSDSTVELGIRLFSIAFVVVLILIGIWLWRSSPKKKQEPKQAVDEYSLDDSVSVNAETRQTRNTPVENTASKSNKNICPVCGDKLRGKEKIQNAVICGECAKIAPNFRIESVDSLKSYWAANRERRDAFHTTYTLKRVFADAVRVDEEHQMFYFEDSRDENARPIVYTFSEIEGYTYDKPGVGLITKSRGNFSGFLGGAVDLVGPVTAKQESGVGLLRLALQTKAGRVVMRVQPPDGFVELLDKCMDTPVINKSFSGSLDSILENAFGGMAGGVTNKTFQSTVSNATASMPAGMSVADELLKLKGLMEEGVITKDEFDAQKAKLMQ